MTSQIADDAPAIDPAPGAARASARERLLAAANELFYAEGIHSVGIDRIIEHAGVAKASLYNTYGSKDELVAAYLRTRHAKLENRINRAVERHRSPRQRLLAVFDAQAESFADPGFHGCAFANATAESHDSRADEAAADYRRWLRSLLTDLSAEAGARDPEALARQLHLLYDGASNSARMDRDGQTAGTERSAAETLLDAALD